MFAYFIKISNVKYRSLPSKCSWALIFQCRFSSYWVLTLCTGRLPCVKIEVGGINVAAIIILYCVHECVHATLPIRIHSIADGRCDRVWHRNLRRKRFSGRFNLWKSEETSKELVEYTYMAWALAISNCRNYTWALAREWALSIHPIKMTTWALTMWWALAWDTKVR